MEKLTDSPEFLKKSCTTMEVFEKELKENPELGKTMMGYEEKIEKWIIYRIVVCGCSQTVKKLEC